MSWHRPVTLASIEREGEHANRRAFAELRSSYLVRFGIHNLWQTWLLGKDSRLNARSQTEIAGYVADEEAE